MSPAPVPTTYTDALDLLEPKHRSFVEHYLGGAGRNAAKAYRLAGYKVTSNKSAANAAARLLVNVGIKRAVELGIAEQSRERHTASIARREERVNALQERWLRMQQVIAERSADPTMQDVPGGKTGLLVRDVKGIGSGENLQVIDLYEVDTALLREMRATEEQAAKELGQWDADQTADAIKVTQVILGLPQKRPRGDEDATGN